MKADEMDEYLWKEALEKFIFLDKRARALNRMLMLEVLASQGVHVHIWGNGWEHYKSNYPEYLPVKVKFLLEHPVLAKEIASRGYKKAKNCHSWEVRAEQMYEILLQIKQSQQETLKEKRTISFRNINYYDEEFNNILKLVQRTEEETLYEKMKHHYLNKIFYEPQNAMAQD